MLARLALPQFSLIQQARQRRKFRMTHSFPHAPRIKSGHDCSGKCSCTISKAVATARHPRYRWCAMSNKVTLFWRPSPLKAETPIEGRIVFEVGPDRFAITELNQKPLALSGVLLRPLHQASAPVLPAPVPATPPLTAQPQAPPEPASLPLLHSTRRDSPPGLNASSSSDILSTEY